MVSPTSAREALAYELLRIGAVSVNPHEPFTWASGLRSPIYCDNRLTISYPAVRRLITEGWAFRIEAERLQTEVVAGTATAGIPHAAWLAHHLDVPMVYVRSGEKGHGRGKQIEGVLRTGQRLLLVEDLISTGGSSLSAVAALREAGAVVDTVFAIFSYEFPAAEEAFAREAVRYFPLVGYSDVLAAAVRTEALRPEEARVLSSWRQDPFAWSERYKAEHS